MPRPKSSTEDEVFSLLREYEGADLHFPATLRTLYSVRNAVYRYNKTNGKRFRCIIRDDGVTLTEKPVRTHYELAAKEIAAVLADAKAEGETDASVLLDRIEDVLKRNFESDGEARAMATPVAVRRKRG